LITTARLMTLTADYGAHFAGEHILAKTQEELGKTTSENSTASYWTMIAMTMADLKFTT
jgi:phosphoribosyl-ATP pyrophosphohydrolase